MSTAWMHTWDGEREQVCTHFPGMLSNSLDAWRLGKREGGIRYDFWVSGFSFSK
jgi:hypothetical protein